MILVTGAAGKTGRATIGVLTARGERVRALVHREDQRVMVERVGAREIVVGDMRKPKLWTEAMSGIRAVYHVCPNMNPDELEIGRLAIDAARLAMVGRFVYHSVLHPHVEAMPHHWQKMRVEETLFASGLRYVILQPAAYMQNILGYWSEVVSSGIFRMPYPTTTRLSLVDLADVAQVVAKVLTEDKHDRAIYELCGPAAPSQDEVAELLGRHLGRPVQAMSISPVDWRRQAASSGLDTYQIHSLCQMFDYYARHDFCGNPGVLGWLLGRPPADLDQVAARWMSAAHEPGVVVI